MRFGLENESTRLNLNALLLIDKQQVGGGRQLLMALPGCTQEMADAILDFIDEDSEPRESARSSNTTAGRAPPYSPKNGQLDTVEELLTGGRGITPQLLFGMDVNCNGMVDSFEEGTGATSIATPGSPARPVLPTPPKQLRVRRAVPRSKRISVWAGPPTSRSSAWSEM